MTPEKVPYLCGGILFSLILQARKTRTKARDKFNGGSDGLKDTDLMRGLVEVVTGDNFDSHGGTFGKCTTQFKTCQDYGTTYIPFTDSAVINSFNSSITKKDPDLLKRMSEFINTYISDARSEWLVKALIEVIQNDADIDSSVPFTVSPDKPVCKAALSGITEINLPIFMLSILGFILNERPDNSKGRATFEAWHTQSSPQAAWKFVSDVGTSNETSISVTSSIEDIVVKDISNSLVQLPDETPQKSAHDRINDRILATGQVIADVLGKALENIADEMDGKRPAPPAKPKLVIEKLSQHDSDALTKFRAKAKPIMIYCIENDPAAGATDLSLSDMISELINLWKYEYREIEDSALRIIVKDTIDILSEYTYYLSDQFLRLLPGGNALWFRNESWEEGEQLRNVLQPETHRIRCEIRDIYLRLYPLPDEEDAPSRATSIQQQTNVVQNGDNNVNLTNNGTVNLKL